jgi:hypothetical protein
MQQFQKEFQKLGQDLQSGDLAAAQSDFATLQQLGPQRSSPSQNPNPIAQAFEQLAQDLQAGNVSAAQQDFATIQQDLQSQAAHSRHHHGGGEANAIGQTFNQLGQMLQAAIWRLRSRRTVHCRRTSSALARTRERRPRRRLLPRLLRLAYP